MILGANRFLTLYLWWTEADSGIAFTGISLGQSFIGLAWE